MNNITLASPSRTSVVRGLRSISDAVLRREIQDAYEGMLENRGTLAYYRKRIGYPLDVARFPSDVYMKLLVRELERRDA